MDASARVEDISAGRRVLSGGGGGGGGGGDTGVKGDIPSPPLCMKPCIYCNIFLCTVLNFHSEFFPSQNA